MWKHCTGLHKLALRYEIKLARLHDDLISASCLLPLLHRFRAKWVLATMDSPKSFVTLGMFIIDDFLFADEEGKPNGRTTPPQESRFRLSPANIIVIPTHRSGEAVHMLQLALASGMDSDSRTL